MSETITRSFPDNSNKVVNDQTGHVDIYSTTNYEEATKALDSDILGFSLNVGDLVWYVDSYSEPLKIGEIISKSKTHTRVKSMVSGIKETKRNIPRHRVHKFDTDYLTSLVEQADGFELPKITDSLPVVDVAGHVLIVGDPVIFSNRKEGSFLLGVIVRIYAFDRILVEAYTGAMTTHDPVKGLKDFNLSKSELAAFALEIPLDSTEVSYQGNITRSANVLKVTAVADRDIQEFYGLPWLLTIVRLGQVLLPDDFKSDETCVYNQQCTYNTSKDSPPYKLNGFDITVVSNELERMVRIEIHPAPSTPPRYNGHVISI